MSHATLGAYSSLLLLWQGKQRWFQIHIGSTHKWLASCHLQSPVCAQKGRGAQKELSYKNRSSTQRWKWSTSLRVWTRRGTTRGRYISPAPVTPSYSWTKQPWLPWKQTPTTTSQLLRPTAIRGGHLLLHRQMRKWLKPFIPSPMDLQGTLMRFIRSTYET